MEYREMGIYEADRIKEIDASYFIKNVWRKIDSELKLVEINWKDSELPNGIEWHLKHFREAIENDGYACGCFDGERLVGFGTLYGGMFGEKSKYILLDQLFVSNDYRNKHIGGRLFSMCAERAKALGADKMYICAGSSENTMAFYTKIGCLSAEEVNNELLEADVNDIQLEYRL